MPLPLAVQWSSVLAVQCNKMTFFVCLFFFLLLKKTVFTLLLWGLDESNEAKIVIFWVFVSNNGKCILSTISILNVLPFQGLLVAILYCFVNKEVRQIHLSKATLILNVSSLWGYIFYCLCLFLYLFFCISKNIFKFHFFFFCLQGPADTTGSIC